jgi:hypothetical protein
MASPLQGLIASKIGAAFASIFYEATLKRTTRTAVSGAPAWDKTSATVAEYACRGMVDQYSDYKKANSLVKAGDRKILITATSLATEPVPGDEVTIRGETFKVIDVVTDPAKAVWELQARK